MSTSIIIPQNAKFVAQYLIPILAVVVQVTMGFSALPAVLAARRNKSIGELNPLPFALLVNAMLGWTIYSLLLKDFYLFIASSFPLITGVIYIYIYVCIQTYANMDIYK
jgi:uncharacterized protein with PQ loop repeat